MKTQNRTPEERDFEVAAVRARARLLAECQRLESELADARRRLQRVSATLTPAKEGRSKAEVGFIEQCLWASEAGLTPQELADLAKASGYAPIAKAEKPRIKASAMLRTLVDEGVAYRGAYGRYRLKKGQEAPRSGL